MVRRAPSFQRTDSASGTYIEVSNEKVLSPKAALQIGWGGPVEILHKRRSSQMNCPKCNSDQIEVMEKTVAVERAGWRHHHGHCRQCRTMLWWNAPLGAVDSVPKTGVHQCAFFSPAASPE